MGPLRFAGVLTLFHKRRLLQRCSNFRKAPYFALHKGIAIGFLKAIGFRNKPKRTIFYFWCSDPYQKITLAVVVKEDDSEMFTRAVTLHSNRGKCTMRPR